MWPRLRFHAMGERRGRAKDGSTLTIWWLDHGHPDLFSSLRAEQLEAKLVVAIDANIFFDLVDSSRPHSEELNRRYCEANCWRASLNKDANTYVIEIAR